MTAELKTQHQRRSSIASDGTRQKIFVGDVSGPFTSWRRRTFFALILFYAAAPFIKIDGRPLIFIDILHRKFFLFGGVFNAQDVYLGFFFLVGAVIALLVVTAMIGRVWCGWACPQTVFLEGVFRPIERWIQGPKHKQIQLEKGPFNWRKFRILATKHLLYLAAAILVSNIFISYFVSLDQLKVWVMGDPRDHWTAFAWMSAIAGVLYFNFAWFREQTCVVVCPYGRLQSALTDDDTLIIGYDENRGEPRGKKGSAEAGDCINCYRCVDVCPTGIDIREGLQLECIGCANCVDACNDIMAKIGRDKGLIRYDSLNGLQKQPKRFARPRILLYLAFLGIFFIVGASFVLDRHPFEASLLRQQKAPYVRLDGEIRNQYLVHIVNKTSSSSVFSIETVLPEYAAALVPIREIRLESLEARRLPLVVSVPEKKYEHPFMVKVLTTNNSSRDKIESSLSFIGP